MKWISFPLLFLAAILSAVASDTVNLAWDYADTSGISSFKVYWGTNLAPAGASGAQFVSIPKTTLTGVISNVPPGITSFQVTAIAPSGIASVESVPSNTAFYTNRNFGPVNLRIAASSSNTAAIWIDNAAISTTVQWSGDLLQWSGWAQVKTLDSTAPVQKAIFLSGVAPDPARYWRAVSDAAPAFAPASVSPLPVGLRLSPLYPPTPGQ